MEVDQKHQDVEYYINYWTPLRITIESFLRPQPNSGLSSFHETFSLIYKCVRDGRATKLYMDLLELCSSHLKTVHAHLVDLTADQLSKKEDKDSNLIKEFDEQLSIYLKASSNILSVFCYLIKFLGEKVNHGCPLEAQLKKIFCQEVAEHFVYHILECLDNTPPPNLDPIQIRHLLNNLKVVSQYKYSTGFCGLPLFSILCSRYGAASSADIYQPAISEVKLAERMCQEEVKSEQICGSVLGLNTAQKRRADERD